MLISQTACRTLNVRRFQWSTFLYLALISLLAGGAFAKGAVNEPDGIIPSPTPIPTSTPLLTPTPTPTPNPDALVLGYFPTNDQGVGTAFFTDNNFFPARDSYSMRVRNSPHDEIYYQNNFVSPGSNPESHNASFALPVDPLDVIPNDPRSWETSIEVRVIARVNGVAVYQNNMLYDRRHPSADLSSFSFDTYVGTGDPPGNYPATFVDSRPTGTSGFYNYEVFRVDLDQSITVKVNTLSHNILGAFLPEKNHSAVVKPLSLPLIQGDQMFYVRPRAVYKTSTESIIGRYDVAPKSPNIYADLVP